MKKNKISIHDDIYSGFDEFTSLNINPFPITKVVRLVPNEEAVKQVHDYSRRLLQKKFKMDHTIEYISLEQIRPFTNSEIKFNPYTIDEHENLKESIKRFGLFSPIILWKTPMGHFLILSGLERVKCYVALLSESYEKNNTSDAELYSTIPAFVIDFEDIDDLRARDIIVDSNLCTRKMDPISYSNAVAAKVAIKIADKELRADINIMDEISEEMMRSKPTLYGYKQLQNLSKGSAFLLQKNVISLKSAKKLAGYSKEIQNAFLNYIGLENVNDLNISVFSLSENPKQSEIQSALKLAKETIVPFFSKVTIKCPTKYLNELKNKIEEIVKKFPKEYLVKARFPKIEV